MSRRMVIALATIGLALIVVVAVVSRTSHSPKPAGTVNLSKLAHALGVNVPASPLNVPITTDLRQREWSDCTDRATRAMNAAGTNWTAYNVGVNRYNACLKRYG